jgi:hypothetical protein
MISATRDSFIPAESSEALWESIRASGARAQKLDLPTDHLMPGSDQLITTICARIGRWLKDF